MKMKIQLPEFLRIGIIPFVLIVFMAIAVVIALVRYAFGIGAISDLSYSFPWGFWISFDLFTGVVISSGGFLMAGSVYILGIKEFKPTMPPDGSTAKEADHANSDPGSRPVSGPAQAASTRRP